MSKLPIHRAAAPKIRDKITRGLGSLPQVVLLRPWRGYSVGAVIRPPGVLRQVLMQEGIAKMFEPKPEPVANAVVEAKPRNPGKTRAPKVETPKDEETQE